MLVQSRLLLFLSCEVSVEEQGIRMIDSTDKSKLTNIFCVISYSQHSHVWCCDWKFSRFWTRKWSDTGNTASVEL